MANQQRSPTLEIWEKGEMYIEKDGDIVYDHLKIILRSADGEYFYAKTNQRLSDVVDMQSLNPIVIPSEPFCPLVDPSFTRAPFPLLPNAYLKRPSRLNYVPGDDLTAAVLTEIAACEILRQHPHPNIARYLGCVVKEGRVTGLAFDKYPTTLGHVLRDKKPFDREGCLRGIEAGVGHMHGLGLVHNDLNPSNIMMDDKGNAVIIDFDSCRREGDEMGEKRGTMEWSLENPATSKRENDLYSLRKLREALLKEEEG